MGWVWITSSEGEFTALTSFFQGLGSFGGLGAPQEGQNAGRSWIHPTDEAFRERVSAPCIQTPALQLNRKPLLDYFYCFTPLLN